MGGRTRFFLLILIMSAVALAAGGATLALLYDTAIDQQRARLRETAQSRARVIEAVAEYDRRAHAERYPREQAERLATDATLGQIRAAHERFEGFGDTGEFTLARRDGDEIAFLLSHRWDTPATPRPVPFSSDLAEPMRRALRGESGTLVGFDYRGARVLAAHEPVDVLDLGVVAKIDLDEVRAPFFRASAVAGGLALLLIFLGAGLFVRIGNPLIRRLEEDERALRRELAERTKAEAAARESDERFRLVSEATRDYIWDWDRESNGVWRNELFYERFGELVPGEDSFEYWTQRIHPDDRDRVLARAMHAVEHGEALWTSEYRLRRPNGEYADVVDRGYAITDSHGETRRVVGAIQDITQRKQAEQELRRIEWMLHPKTADHGTHKPPYGDLAELNTSRLILDSVGKELLAEITADYISVLGTSGAIYEANGDYALGIFSSGWCQFLDAAAYAQCGTGLPEALTGGQWHCHESCWQDASKAAMDSACPVDVACHGGIHLYAVPIRAGEEIVGAMNVGWGDPPTDDATLRQIAEKYGVGFEVLREQAHAYESRPPYLVAMAKRRLETAAVLIGEMVQRRRVEAKLKEQTTFLQTLIDGIPSPVFWKSADGIYRGCNRAFCDRLGRSREAIVGRGLHALFPQEVADTYQAADTALFQAPGRQEYEYRIQHVDGSERDVLYQKATYLGPDGEVAGLVGVATDISELKRTEAALRSSEQRLAEAQRIAGLGDFIWNTGTGEVNWSDALYELVGYDKSVEIDYSEVNTRIHYPEDLDDISQWLSEAIESDSDILPPKEYRLTRADGTVMHVRTRGIIRRPADEAPVVIGTVLDITDRVGAQRALQESQRQLSTLIANLPGVAYRCANDSDWTMEFISDACVKLTGYQPGELIANARLSYGSVIRPSDRQTVWDVIQQALQNREIFDVSYRITPADGSEKWVSEQGQGVFDDSGRVVAIEGYIVDVTERKRAESRLAASEERLRSMFDQQFQFMAILSPDGIVQDVNELVLRIQHAAREDYVGKPFWHSPAWRNLPDWQETVKKQVLQAASSTEPILVEDCYQTSDGNVRFANAAYSAIRDSSGQIRFLLVQATDITERKKAEEALREQHVFSESLIETAQAIILVLDPQGRIVRFNPYTEELTGYRLDEVRGNDWFATLQQSKDELALEPILHNATDRIQTRGKLSPIITKDGRELLVEWYNKTLIDKDGQAAGLLAIGHDITERTRIETERERSRKLFSDVLDAMPDMVWLKDADGFYLMCNQELARLVNSTKERIIGGTDYDIFPPEKADFYCEHDRKAIANRATTINEESADYVHAGYSIWIETSKTPVYDSQGDLIGVLGVGRDISRRKEALQESREKQAFLDLVVDRSPVPMWIGSPNGTALRANQAFYSALNLTPEQIAGKYNLLQDDNFKRAEIVEKIDLVLRRQQPVTFDLLWKPDLVRGVDFSGGRSLHIDASVFPLLNQDGEMTHVIVQWVDVTERKRAEQELARHRDHLEELVSERTAELERVHEKLLKQERLATLGHLTATVSHELRNPLGTIRTSLFMIGERVRGQEAAIDDEIARAERGIVRCNRIIEEMLDFVRSKEITREETAVDGWLAGVLDEATLPKGVSLERSLSAGVSVALDRERIRRAVVNLVTNAWQAIQEHEPSGGTLRVETIVVGERLEIRFSDTGPGVPSEDLERIMEPLYSTKGFGVGLGLPIVRQIMEMHQGGIEIGSAVGQGTTATLWLPLAE